MFKGLVCVFICVFFAHPIKASELFEITKHQGLIAEPLNTMQITKHIGNNNANKQRQKENLISFNGYYALENTTNGFFSVDTNYYQSSGSPEPQSIVSLIISLDGKHSQSCVFSGSFNNNRLRQTTLDGIVLDLTFERKSCHLGPTAVVKGQITLPGQAAEMIYGVTYCNPIPIDLWAGQNYYAPSTVPGGNPTIAVKITKNGKIFYDQGIPGGELIRVASYQYNSNMYYFTFTNSNGDTTNLIMNLSN